MATKARETRPLVGVGALFRSQRLENGRLPYYPYEGPFGFSFQSRHNAHSGITVNVRLSQTGDYATAADLGEKQVIIAGGESLATLTVAIDDDDIDEPDGSIVATLFRKDGVNSGYHISADYPDVGPWHLPTSATVAILDDDDPPTLTITADAPSKEEGAPAVFTIRIIGQAPASPVVIDNLTVVQEGNFFPDPPPTSVTIPAGETVFKLTIRTADN